MVTIKIDYTDGSELLRECKNYSIVFDPYNKIESYTLIRGKENIVTKLKKYVIAIYSQELDHPSRKRAIEIEQPEIEYLKAVFSSIDLKRKPFLIPLILQFLTNYEKNYGNKNKQSGKHQIQTN